MVSAGILYHVSCSVSRILIDLTTFCNLFIALFTFIVTFDDFRVSIELACGRLIIALVRAYDDWYGLIFYAFKGFFNCNNLD